MDIDKGISVIEASRNSEPQDFGVSVSGFRTSVLEAPTLASLPILNF
jgi:hypothetical protein